MKIPYDKLSLIVALVTLDEKKLTEEKVNELVNKLEPALPREEVLKKIAEDNMISVDALINSPNYNILCNEYADKKVLDFIESLKKELDISDIQAYAIYAECEGLLS